MKNLKKIILIQLTLLCVLFASCKTTEENIFTMSQESGQLVFLRPVTLDNKAFPLRKTSFDITVNIVDFELTDSNIVNYTLYFPEEYYNSERRDKHWEGSVCRMQQPGRYHHP